MFSKEDEEVLKAEYAKNPKPDKAARIEIVTKVALGEKEVQVGCVTCPRYRVSLGDRTALMLLQQIWFQNRRQNDRRRSQPLDRTPSLMSSSSIMSDPLVEEEPSAPEADAARVTTPHREHVEPQTAAEDVEPSKPERPTESVDEQHAQDTVQDSTKSPSRTVSEEAVTDSPEPEKAAESHATVDLSVIQSTDPQTIDTAPTELSSSQQNASSSQGASQSRTNWISNRRSASFMRSADDYAPEVITFPHPSQPAQPVQANASATTTTTTTTTATATATTTIPPPTTRTVKRTHSFVRISTNEDGTARIVTDLDKTPSPPHPRTSATPFARAAAGLRRSYSAAGLNERLAAAAREERSPKMPRTSPFGRSRDSRAWEFWCDPDTRYNTSLTTRAEQEGSGSAADAIGLLRANRKILQQNQARQNTPIKRGQSAKYVSPQYSGVKKARGPMQRAATVNGRLQSKGSDGSESDDLLQTDSDKENWVPVGPKSQQRGRKVYESPAVQRTRKILGENTEIMSQSNSLGYMLERSGMTPRKTPRRSSDPEQDDELRAFMGGDHGMSARTAVSSAEEAGCVEGLLKLSQGQWR